MINLPGLPIVISGPSGVGKGTLIKRICECLPRLEVSVSTTTRKPRRGEKEGESYFFVTKNNFQDKINNDFFLEWAQVYGHYYGTSRLVVKEAIENGKDVLLELDVQGALQIKSKLPDSVLLFIAPPSLSELRRRITTRGTENKAHIEKRMQIALQELKSYKHYDYVLINDRIEETASNIKAIIIAEKCRVARNPDLWWD